MKRSVIILSGLMLFSISLAPYAGAEQRIPGPPLAQSLVREGTLAMNLAHAFKLGLPASEAEAESSLTAVAIAPRNGWIADYPVTPDVVIELRDAVGRAVDARRLALDKVEALQIFDNITKDYELPVQAVNTGPAVSPVTPPAPVSPDPVVINNYYTQEGPPVVTYYAPPVDYSYLYSYVPYPFWWSNAWFPGYYMLRDFSLLALGYGAWYHGYWPGYGYGYWGGYGRYGYWGAYGYGSWWGGRDHYYGHHDRHHDGHHGDDHNGRGGHGGDRHVVSNHHRNHDTGATHRIDPAKRAHSGFNDRNLAGGQKWADSSVQKSAKAIYDRSHNTNLARNSGNRRESWRDRTAYNSSSNRGSASQRNFNADQAGNSGNNRQFSNNRTAYKGSYNRGSNSSTGRAYTASARSYSASGSYRQPSQRASYQTRQSVYSQGRGRAYNASYSANRGQFGNGRSFSSNGRGGSYSGRGGGGFSSGRASGGGRRN